MTVTLLTSAFLQQALDTPPDSSGNMIFVYVVLAIVAIIAGYVWWNRRNKQHSEASERGTSPDQASSPKNKPVTASAPRKRGTKSASGEPPAIFISYRRQDSSDVTGRIYDRLSQHFGKQSVFKDVDSIPLGVDFRKHLGDSVGKCDVLIAVIGRQWLAGEGGSRLLNDARDFVRVEVEAALQRDIPVVPVLVQGAQVPKEDELPESIRSLSYRNGIAVRPDPDFHQDMDRLINGIEGHLKK